MPYLIQLNGIDLGDADEILERKGNKKVAEIQEDTIPRLKERILERSRMRHQNDRIQMERDWEQKKLKLDSIKASMNEKFRFNKND